MISKPTIDDETNNIAASNSQSPEKFITTSDTRGDDGYNSVRVKKHNNYLEFRVHVAPQKLEGISLIWEMF